MKKLVNLLFVLLILSVFLPQQIHAEIDGKKLVKEAKEAAIYGTPTEEHQIPYVTGTDTTVPHYEGVPVEQVKKDAEEIHRRKKHKVPEPIELTIAIVCKPFVIAMISNPLINFILVHSQISPSMQNNS